MHQYKRLIVQLGALLIAIVTARFVDGRIVSVIWLSTAIGLAVWWDTRDGRRPDRLKEPGSSDLSRSPSINFRVVPLVSGAVFSLFAALAELNTVRSVGLDISLVGVPFFWPIGSVALGAIAGGGYCFAKRFKRGSVGRFDVYFSMSFSILTMLLCYALLYSLVSKGVSLAAFLHGYFLHGVSQWTVPRVPVTGIIGPSPVAYLTPIVQVFGFAFGGAVVSYSLHRVARWKK